MMAIIFIFRVHHHHVHLCAMGSVCFWLIPLNYFFFRLKKSVYDDEASDCGAFFSFFIIIIQASFIHSSLTHTHTNKQTIYSIFSNLQTACANEIFFELKWWKQKRKTKRKKNHFLNENEIWNLARFHSQTYTYINHRVSKINLLCVDHRHFDSKTKKKNTLFIIIIIMDDHTNDWLILYILECINE